VIVAGCLTALEVDWSALFSTLVGAGAAVLGVVLGAVLGRKHAVEARRAVVIGGIRALWAEMAVNMERYDSLRFNLELLHELKRVNDEGARTWTSELEMRRLDLERQLALYGQNFVKMDELLSKAFSEISPRVAALG